MTHAYDEQYLSDAMNNLGEMMDYAVNTCHFEINEFFDMFLVSDLAGQFAKGVPKVVSGMSGVELAMEVVRKSGADMELPDAEAEYDRSPEYWCGWIVAFVPRDVPDCIDDGNPENVSNPSRGVRTQVCGYRQRDCPQKKAANKAADAAEGVRLFTEGTGRKVGGKSQDPSGV